MSFYQHINQMEPMMPSEPLPNGLEDMALEIIRESAKLGAMIHPITRGELAKLFREMNSYYSNLIEGHKTSPIDIQRALKQDFSQDFSKRLLQLESIAHIAVQELMETKIKNEPDLNICNSDFLCWIHNEFYERLPQEFRKIEGKEGELHIVEPGRFRTQTVIVGQHVPPDFNTLTNFMERFSEVYNPKNYNAIMQLIATAAAHHRLAWIHPFLDGNGRVVRLFSDAYFIKTNVDSHGLWTISRGLARNRAEYMHALSMADNARQGDLDGRGNLSLKGLNYFCEFFLKIALDQIKFVSTCLDLDNLQHRIDGYVQYLVGSKKIKPEAAALLKTILLKGEVARGEVPRITGMAERTARNLTRSLLGMELIISNSPKGPLRLGFPISAVYFYFPALYNNNLTY